MLEVVAREQAARGVGDQPDVAGLPREALHARGDVDRIAYHRELEPAPAAHRAHHDPTGVDPDAEANWFGA
jgi:hypothetical protein